MFALSSSLALLSTLGALRATGREPVTSHAAAPGPACAPAPGVSGSTPALGPCRFPDTLDVLLPAAPAAPLLVANFGIFFPGAGTSAPALTYDCEESFGSKLPNGVQLDGAGQVLIPATTGLYRTGFRDGCSWARSLADSDLWAVAPDPSTPGKIWAVAGMPARQLFLSMDGGAMFTPTHTFDADFSFLSMGLAPSDPRTLYLTGYSSTAPFIVAASADGGTSFSIINPAAGFSDRERFVEFLAVAPDDPKTIYLALAQANGSGDEIWKSADGGHTATKMLTLAGVEIEQGFAFGATPQTIYVAGRPVVAAGGDAVAHLYVSRDGAKTWEPPVPSGAAGPRYRCLRYRDGVLFACAGGSIVDDDFLLGQSVDEGKTWSSIVRLNDLSGPKACFSDACLATTEWLCDSYNVCPTGAPTSDAGPADADAAAGVDAGHEGGAGDEGCGCRVGRAGAGAGPACAGAGAGSACAGAAGLALVVAARRRRRRCA